MSSDRSLEGVTILVTRPREQAGDLVGLLEERGAEVLDAPTIAIGPGDGAALDRVAGELVERRYRWVVVTSVNGVRAIADALGRIGQRWPAVEARVGAIGEKTARAVREEGGRADLVPSPYTSEALAEAFPSGAGRVLLARADVAPAGLEEALAAKGWTPTRVEAYRTTPVEVPAEIRRRIAEGRVDAVTFASASAVDGFMAGVPAARPGPARVVCIGPVTAGRARDLGFRVDAVAHPHTIEGLVSALEDLFATRPPTEGSAP